MSRGRSYLLGRWGLLATTVAMGIALVATGGAGYLGARQGAEALIRSRSVDLTLSIRRDLRAGGGLDVAALTSTLEELSEQGVRYLGIYDGSGAVIVEAGTPIEPVTRSEVVASRLAIPPEVQWHWVDDAVRVVATGRGRMLGGPGGVGHGPGEGRGPGAGHGGWPQGREVLTLVFDFDPAVARTMMTTALTMLVVSGAAAVLLTAVALVSFRKSREAETLTHQLARDQQLKSLGQMSAVLSHELRNPLAALKGHAQLLVEKLAPADAARPSAERIVKEALRLEALADQILDFARPHALERHPESPVALARAAIEAVADERVRLIADATLPAWSLNRLRMEQLLVNLIRNATQASPAGAPIEVGVASEGAALVFSVRDRGPGLPPGDEARIFEPFYTGRVRGTGLGLAIAKQIAEAHGGRIEGVTHPEGGALFRVVLPGPPCASEESQ